MYTSNCIPCAPRVTRTPVYGSQHVRPGYGAYRATQAPVCPTYHNSPTYYGSSYSRPYCGFSSPSSSYSSTYYTTEPRRVFRPIENAGAAALTGIVAGAIIFAALL